MLLVTATDQARAQDVESDSLLKALLQANRYTLTLAGDKLDGLGADFLIQEGQQAQFFMIGESHGIAEVPQFTSALFQALRPVGYDHLVIETGPHTARLLERLARGGRDSLATVYHRYPFSVPFYTWYEEAQLLVDAVQDAEGTVLWGVDQEFIAAPVMLLAELERSGPTENARMLAHEYRIQAQDGQQSAFKTGDMRQLFMSAATASDYAALRMAFAEDLESVALIDGMEASAEIYNRFNAGENYHSNRLRTDLMRQTFADYYRRVKGEKAVGPKAILKFGGIHLYRGWTPVNMLDVGTMATMLADAEGAHTFNVRVVAGPGTETATFTPAGFSTVPVGHPAWVAPLLAAADTAKWTVFDLRPLRPLLHAGQLALEPDLEQLIWGYDAYLVLSGSRPSGF